VSVPVLMYHHVLPKESFIATSTENFEKQMKFISQNYKTLTTEEFVKYKKGQLKFDKKAVLITFDDGWRDNYIYAYPILKKYNLKATLFVITGWIDKASEKSYDFIPRKHNECKKIVKERTNAVVLNWDEVEKMRDVFDIHSHTHFHRDDYFGKISLEDELILSKETLEKHNIFSNQLCWPRGIYNDCEIELAKSAGYEVLYTTKRGVNIPDKKLDEIKRISVKKDDKWIKKQLFIFSNNILGSLYSKVKK
jgi:peptidoglycan/xylan/chitin deacetylase (PgdA/CDA1 family)